MPTSTHERGAYLVFDTETTGIPRDHDAPASDVGNWPRLVQIAWLLADAEGRELRSQAFIIRPDGFDIPDGAARVHGIDSRPARQAGVEVASALDAFAADLTETEMLVAHNVRFDERVIGAEFFPCWTREEPDRVEDPLLHHVAGDGLLPDSRWAAGLQVGRLSTSCIGRCLELGSRRRTTPSRTSERARPASSSSSAGASYDQNGDVRTRVMPGRESGR